MVNTARWFTHEPKTVNVVLTLATPGGQSTRAFDEVDLPFAKQLVTIVAIHDDLVAMLRELGEYPMTETRRDRIGSLLARVK